MVVVISSSRGCVIRCIRYLRVIAGDFLYYYNIVSSRFWKKTLSYTHNVTRKPRNRHQRPWLRRCGISSDTSTKGGLYYRQDQSGRRRSHRLKAYRQLRQLWRASGLRLRWHRRRGWIKGHKAGRRGQRMAGVVSRIKCCLPRGWRVC